ncbi:hypothetical protein GGS20DRAFT_571557 [Poronia punctata]|nr:hypothetical protein GGS20DRAFT_571557 [Poronia punctata]
MNSSAKRARQDSIGPSHVPSTSPQPSIPQPPAAQSSPTVPIEEMINKFDQGTMERLLCELADKLPEAQSLVRAYHEDQLRRELNVADDFKQYSSDIWYSLYLRYPNKRDRGQNEMACEAVGQIERYIRTIADKAHVRSSIGRKLSAVETLAKIGKLILLAEGTFGSEVRECYKWDGTLADVMLRIVEFMTPKERRVVARRDLLADMDDLLSRQDHMHQTRQDD